jgi:hypothetical protein
MADVNGPTILAKGFTPRMLAYLDREGLATVMIAERVKDGGKVVEVVRIKITAAGRKAIEV